MCNSWNVPRNTDTLHTQWFTHMSTHHIFKIICFVSNIAEDHSITSTHTHTHPGSYPPTQRHRHKEIDRHSQTNSHRHTHTHTHTSTEPQTHTHTHTHILRASHRYRETDPDTHSLSHFVVILNCGLWRGDWRDNRVRVIWLLHASHRVHIFACSMFWFLCSWTWKG